MVETCEWDSCDVIIVECAERKKHLLFTYGSFSKMNNYVLNNSMSYELIKVFHHNKGHAE